MARYQRRVVEVEAMRVGGAERPAWYHQALAQGIILAVGDASLIVFTKQMPVRAEVDDYLVMGARGNLWVVEAHEFDALYEPVARPENATPANS